MTEWILFTYFPQLYIQNLFNNRFCTYGLKFEAPSIKKIFDLGYLKKIPILCKYICFLLRLYRILQINILFLNFYRTRNNTKNDNVKFNRVCKVNELLYILMYDTKFLTLWIIVSICHNALRVFCSAHLVVASHVDSMLVLAINDSFMITEFFLYLKYVFDR